MSAEWDWTRGGFLGYCAIGKRSEMSRRYAKRSLRAKYCFLMDVLRRVDGRWICCWICCRFQYVLHNHSTFVSVSCPQTKWRASLLTWDQIDCQPWTHPTRWFAFMLRHRHNITLGISKLERAPSPFRNQQSRSIHFSNFSLDRHRRISHGAHRQDSRKHTRRRSNR